MKMSYSMSHNNGIPFDNEPGKIRDMKKMSKEDFLAFYSYLTEADYDATAKKLNYVPRPHIGKCLTKHKAVC